MSETKIVSQIVGILVNENLSSKEVINVLEKTKETYLERSYHINSEKKADW